MKTIVKIIFLFISFITFSQCYNNETSLKPPYYLSELKITNEEQKLRDFFNLKIEFWEFSNADRFCYQKSDTLDVKLTINKNIINSKIKSPIYAHLLAYYFQSKHTNNKLEKELQADVLAGYYYCYQNITKNWKTIKSDVTKRINKAKELNTVMEAYINLYHNYSNKNENSIRILDRKIAFLKGTYYAMPPKYRMQVHSKIDYQNDIALLFSDIQKEDEKNKLLSNSLNANLTLENLVFVIKESKN